MSHSICAELPDILSRDPAFSRLAQRAGQKPINVAGLTETQKAPLALALARQHGQKPCFLVPDELRARALATELRAWLPDAVLVFRPRELHLTDAEAVSREEEEQRLAILSRILAADYGALIVPAAATLQKLLPPQQFRARQLHIKAGSQDGPEWLIDCLAGAGYERLRLVEAAGQFTVRGDIVDILVPAAEDAAPPLGVRVSFFDREIDSIRLFDPETQRSVRNLDHALLPPVRELIPDPEARTALVAAIIQAGDQAALDIRRQGTQLELAEDLRRLARQDAQRLEAQLPLAAIDRWLPLIIPEAASVLDYIMAERTMVFLDEPLRFRNRLDGAQAELDERLRQLLAKGQILPLTAEIAFRGVDASRCIDRANRVIALVQIASSGNGLPGADSVTFSGRPTDSYYGREDRLLRDIKHNRDQEQTTLIFSGSDARRDRLLTLLREQRLGSAATVLAEGLPRGFVWPAAGLHVIGAQDLFGSERPARRRRQAAAGLKIDLFSDLVPGELVVHEAHGIGRYEGLANLDSGGVRRDYLKISYAGTDTLFIPMESLNQIQKYIGADAREPKLSKLGGQEWNRMKDRARDSIRKLATDLIRLYAERQRIKGHAFAPDTVWQQEFEERFPYVETEDQLRCTQEIKADMESHRVMDRLLCGDVGFGKTEVAFRAIFKCVMDSRQALLLAPTTVLAQQHYENLRQRLEGFPIEIGLLSRFATPAEQREVIHGLQNGRIDVVVGTHRVLSQDVRPRNLGLLVVDEEQRFGVDHKEKTKSQWPAIDVLTLTATPIPRTLHMAMSGIRDISVLEEAPHDRRPVQTYVMEYDADIVAEAILREVSRQGQVFYLFNDTRKIDEKTAELERLLPGVRILTGHAKMSERLLEDVIAGFVRQEADILVCTTIIESGIDMPNVNTIIVENADRLGLAQLYQLRGRVGRSDRQAFAYVTYRRDQVLSEIAEKRLATIRDFTELGSGFKIALRDLEVRGAGNLLGAEQSGQLDAIGYDLYCRMLEEEIQTLKGESPPEKISAIVDLELDAFIPRSLINDEGLRIDAYRRVADIASAADRSDVLDEWIDRFGDPPEEALTLLDVAYIRSAAERQGMVRIFAQGAHVVMQYGETVQPDMQAISRLLALPAYRGLLLFNAGSRPHLVFRQAAAEKRQMAGRLRQLFLDLEPADHRSDRS